MNRKKLITILAAITIIATLGVSLFYAQFDVSATTYNTDSMTVEGVLASDNYPLFPFAKKNLKIGFSKYGEMIDGITDTGLAYDGYDAFAPPAGVVKWQWVEGWIINITYVEGGYYKNVWAMATHSDYHDSAGIGGPWHENVTCGSTGLAVRGGRKTSGGAVTEPIKVLYDGPRRFVALLNTTIYAEPAHDAPLVRITFTIVFNKVKKQVIILKDIKRIDIGKNIWDMQIEFGDRGEWDLGASTAGAAPKSYAHIFENQSTVYNGDYQSWYNTAVGNYNGTYDVCQVIDDDLEYVGWAAFWPKPIVTWVGSTQLDADRPFILTSTSTKTEVHTLATGDDRENFTLIETPADYPQKNATGIFWKEDPMVFHNDHIKVINGTTTSEMVYYFRGNNTVKFPTGYWPAVGDTVKIVYKHLRPHADMSSEPASPFVVGEWAFRMYEHSDTFRGVTVYGITDLNDGNDAGRAGSNVLDCEVQYYLNETFNPYDLYSAVHKQESRWVDFFTVATTTVDSVTLTEGLDDDIWCNKTDLAWSGYELQSGDNGTAEWVNEFEDVIDAHSKNWALKLYAINDTATGTGEDYARVRITPAGFGQNGTYYFGNLTEISFWYKKITGNATYGPHIFVKLSNGTAGNEVNVQMYDNNVPSPSGWVKVDLSNIATFTGQTADNSFWYYADGWTKTNKMDDLAMHEGGTLASFDFYRNKLADYYVTDICVEFGFNLGSGENGTYLIDDIDVGYLTGTDSIRYERVYNMEEDKLIPSDWDAYCSFAERVLVNGTLAERVTSFSTPATYLEYTINFETGLITFGTYLPVGTDIVKVLYSTIEENEKGRYEWIVVGKNAATIDSLATAYVAQAFDSIKDIHVQVAGLDMNETTYGPYAPFVMGGATTGTRTDYYYNYPSDNRTGLRDDWCKTYPISSSNMIFMAGPRANLGTEYFNEFTNAFFAESEYVVNNTGQANKILALTCWDRNTYGNGYAVISVYKDLNGTIGLLFSGYQGQDFYYACKWFWDYPAGITTPDGTTVYSGIEYLQHENRGVTDIILHIDYSTCCPTVGIVSGERLGTISEKGQHDCPAPWY